MSNLAARLRARRAHTRTRRAVSKAIDTATTTTMRDELITLAQTHGYQKPKPRV
ncbi:MULTISPECIES: hypothetical protein [Prauserella salsuginis group]|uniref:Uncharacterized protein n=2 Tax=Prauserella salsuginis group TaxID=2893672 RepID=A0A839XLX8_9PSEU|nr:MULTISPECIES: hypothetical protein [Prauserella salsuginis group]MBB3662829.1 hypothetical protein [Prauserella sediminis]MCR3720525.1 hypothetical protein [Prauserella flava]MCR3733765.1 hypothetical protein [Prauserella salsuginis]